MPVCSDHLVINYHHFFYPHRKSIRCGLGLGTTPGERDFRKELRRSVSMAYIIYSMSWLKRGLPPHQRDTSMTSGELSLVHVVDCLCLTQKQDFIFDVRSLPVC